MRAPLPLLLAVLAASHLNATEVPIASVVIGPDGALVTHVGVVGADETITGLPLVFDGARASLVVAGLDSPPPLAPRTVVPDRPELPAGIERRRAELALAYAALDARFDAALELEGLAQRVLERPEGSAVTPAVALLGPGAQEALRGFLLDNMRRAREALAAIASERQALKAAIADIDRQMDAAFGSDRATMTLPVPGSAGREVRLSYLVPEARWAPTYRLEVADGRGVLHREALVDVPAGYRWRQGSLILTTAPRPKRLFVADLRVPTMAVVEEVLERSGPVRQAFSSESAVEATLHPSIRDQNADGSWGEGSYQGFASGLTTLTFLGAGYDHKIPNRYRKRIGMAIDWIKQHGGRQVEISAFAVCTMALCEAYAMTHDPELKPIAQEMITTLVQRALDRGELRSAVDRNGPMLGPEAVAYVIMAAKSARSGGLEVDFDRMPGQLALVDGHPDRHEAATARWVGRIFLGQSPTDYDDFPPVEEWLQQVPSWFDSGRPELVYFGTLTCFQVGGEAWQRWNNQVRDQILERHSAGTDAGSFRNICPHPGGDQIARSFLELSLETYYRYTPVRSMPGSRQSSAPSKIGPEPLPDVVAAAKGWPLRYTVGSVALATGLRQRVHIDALELPGSVGLRAVPQITPGAWRSLTTANPDTLPLPQGAMEVVDDGTPLGITDLPFTAPDAPIVVELGREHRVRVVREESRRASEAWGMRSLEVTVAFRVMAPPGIADALRIVEPMPKPADPAIQLSVIDPALEQIELDRRLAEDPHWRFDLDLSAGEASQGLVYRLRYPTDRRPIFDVDEQGAQP